MRSSDTKEKRSEYNRRWRERHPEYEKAQHQRRRASGRGRYDAMNANAKRRGHMPPASTWHEFRDWFAEHVLKANGRCECCGTEFSAREPVVDHCHYTGRLRGLVCGPCNKIEGMATCTSHLRCVIRYLESR